MRVSRALWSALSINYFGFFGPKAPLWLGKWKSECFLKYEWNWHLFFQNSCCQVVVTQLDIESKYSIKKPFSCNCTAAPGCARYLPMNFSTFWSPNCPVCKEMSPFWPILCEKVIFRTGFWYLLDLKLSQWLDFI